MSSTDDGQIAECRTMNAAVDIDLANRFARVLEDSEARRLGVRITTARDSVARRLKIAPGTLENIRRFRIKTIPNWLMARIRTEFVAVLQTEIRRLEHEIHLARQIGDDPRENILVAAETQLAEAKALLTGGGE